VGASAWIAFLCVESVERVASGGSGWRGGRGLAQVCGVAYIGSGFGRGSEDGGGRIVANGVLEDQLKGIEMRKYRIVHKKFKDGREQFGVEEQFLWVFWVHLYDQNTLEQALNGVAELKERNLSNTKAARDRVVHVE
jgi:hypothetical protein